MTKLKYVGGITKLITSKVAEKNKIKFKKYLSSKQDIESIYTSSKNIDLDLVSFSSSKDFYDQVLSILSFLRFVGKPVSWTINSDGSHNQDEISFLNKNFSFVKIIKRDWQNQENLISECKEDFQEYKSYLVHYTQKSPYGKKLFSYLNHQIQRPTLLLDADILFYNKAYQLLQYIMEDENGWYLPDYSWGCLDSRYMNESHPQPYQINSGFILMNKSIKTFIESFNFIKNLDFSYEQFTEQTFFHILCRSNNFMPFDPRTFILNSGDQFDFSYIKDKKDIAIRHFTGPVRHKMWQKDWEWQLS